MVGWVGGGGVFSGEGLVDEGLLWSGWWGVLGICLGACLRVSLKAGWGAAFGEEAAFDQGDAHGGEVGGCGVAGFDELVFLVGIAFDGEGAEGFGVGEGKMADGSDGGDAGSG